jgi:hypothetical protein
MRALLLACLVLHCAAAAAQLRTIPQDAKRGSISHREVMAVEIDGRPERLAPGAQIRDAANRLVLPTALPPNSLVKFERDPDGLIRRVWILSAEEAKRED